MQKRPVPLSSAILAAIVIVGLVLRLRGITFGLPAVYNPDEIAIMSRALAFAKGDLNPHNFLYPTFYFYALFAWIGGYFVMARLAGQYASAAAFERQFFVDPSAVYLAGRLLSVVCGALTIVAVYHLGRRVFDRAVGLSAAAFVAVAPYAVRDAHYVKHDVPATLLIVLAYIAIANLVPNVAGGSEAWRSKNRRVILAAALYGLACSTHYYTIFLGGPLLWAIWIGSRHDGASFLRLVSLAALTAAVVFFVASPFIVVEPATVVRDVVANRQIVVDRAVAQKGGLFASATAYASMLGREAVGWPVTALAVAGAFVVAATSLRVAVLLLSFPVAFFLFISNTVAAGRYLNPLIPLIALLAAVALVRAARVVGPAAAPIAVAALTLVTAVPAQMLSVRTGTFFRQTDTRTLALEFIERTIPPDATIAVQPYSTPLRPTRASLREGLTAHGIAGDAVPTKFSRQLSLEPYPAPAYRLIYLGDGGFDQEKIYVGYSEVGGPRKLAALRQHGVQYLVVKRYNRPDPATLPFLDALASEGTLLAVFSPFAATVSQHERNTVEPYLHNTDTPLSAALERPGPVIEIWKLA